MFRNYSTGWVDGSQGAELIFYQLGRFGDSVEVTFCLKLKENFSWSVYYRGCLVNKEECGKIKEVSSLLNSGNYACAL